MIDLRKQKLTAELLEVLSCLYRGESLPAKYKDLRYMATKRVGVIVMYKMIWC
ncbi:MULTISPECIES: hypothetical protein [Moraxella]|uniref:hypothetical protein n=1 Tax=Moraxella TaxID=475 RepID=UPI001D0D20CE|nr:MULTISPECIES: hypothetical protein [Moraxella]MDH9220092.1 hypothetical protein [Moraxella lacunata]